MQGVSGSKLHNIYFAAWMSGMKTTYYLRSLGASQIEKSTLDAKKYGFTQKRTYATSDETTSATQATTLTAAQACSIMNAEDCEACQ